MEYHFVKMEQEDGIQAQSPDLDPISLSVIADAFLRMRDFKHGKDEDPCDLCQLFSEDSNWNAADSEWTQRLLAKEPTIPFFLQACTSRHVDVAKWIYRMDPHPLMIPHACRSGNEELMRWLLAHNPTLEVGDAFAHACGAGNLPVAQYLWSISQSDLAPPVHKIDLEISSERAVNWACQGDHWETVEWLFQIHPATKDNPTGSIPGWVMRIAYCCIWSVRDGVIERSKSHEAKYFYWKKHYWMIGPSDWLDIYLVRMHDIDVDGTIVSCDDKEMLGRAAEALQWFRSQ